MSGRLRKLTRRLSVQSKRERCCRYAICRTGVELTVAAAAAAAVVAMATDASRH